MPAKGRQISVRVLRETDEWLERRAGGRSNKAHFVRSLIEREMAREREETLIEVFNKAAVDVTESDRAEREQLLEAFSGSQEEETQAKVRKRKGAG